MSAVKQVKPLWTVITVLILWSVCLQPTCALQWTSKRSQQVLSAKDKDLQGNGPVAGRIGDHDGSIEEYSSELTDVTLET